MKTDEEMKSDRGGKVLPFSGSVQTRSMNEAALRGGLLQELLAPLRASEERERIRSRLDINDEAVEEALLQSEVRARLTPCIQAYTIEQLPIAITQFYVALRDKESWAYKILLEAMGFPELVGNVLAAEESESEVVISSAFERDIVLKMLDRLRGRGRHSQTSEETPKDHTT